MRYAVSVILLILGWHCHGAVLPPPYVQFQTFTALNVGPGETNVTVQYCPSDTVPLYRTDPNTRPNDVEIRPILVERTGQPLNLPAPLPQLFGAGHRVEIFNRSPEPWEGFVLLNCGSAPPDVTVTFQRALPPAQTTFFPITCPPPLVPLGFVTNADGVDIQERSRVYLIGASLIPLNGIADGVYPGRRPRGAWAFATRPLSLCNSRVRRFARTLWMRKRT